jgi:hypothetical protein
MDTLETYHPTATGETSRLYLRLGFLIYIDLFLARCGPEPRNQFLLGQAHDVQSRIEARTDATGHEPRKLAGHFILPVAMLVIKLKGGIPKIWGETLLLLLLFIIR